MPTIKGKGGAASHRYRSASEYDDSTLAQKREYWRTKKREQRARLSERGGKQTQDSTAKILHLNSSAVNSSLSGVCASSSSLQRNDQPYKTADVSPTSRRGIRLGDGSLEAAESQKEKWPEPMKLNKMLPQLPAEAAGGKTSAVRRQTARDPVSRAVTSPTASGIQLNTSSSVPPVRTTRVTNGSSAKATPQPCVSMQRASASRLQHKVQVVIHTQPKHSSTNSTAGNVPVSSSCGSLSIKTRGEAANPTPQIGIKSALGNTLGAKGAANSKPLLESEEEMAARRREHWRIKKREQRAKLAARLAKTRERTQSTEEILERQTAQRTGLLEGAAFPHLPSQSFSRGAGQKPCPPRGRTSFTFAKRENYKMQTGTAVSRQADQIKIQHPQPPHTVVLPEKKPGESWRKIPSYVHLSNVSRGIARCKTPRQRFIEAQKSFMNQRNIRGKSLSLLSVFSTRNIPRIDPNDTPEQIIAKRREYWRVKKREQRAKLSMEMKARLKERDSLMRRVKRYQRILEEMRRARALSQSAGSSLTHASETIGGFIKEDGTVTSNIPQNSTNHNTVEFKSEEEPHVVSNNTPVTQPQCWSDTKWRSIAPIVNQPPPPLPPQVKVSFPLAGQSVNKPARLISIRPVTHLESTIDPKSPPPAAPTVSQLTLTRPQTRQHAVAESSRGGCVMKMAVSSSAPSLSALAFDPGLTEEERMVKKREYWRVKKREQRAARAARLKQGVIHARASLALQRRKGTRQVAVNSVSLNRCLTGNAQPPSNCSPPVITYSNEIKQESEAMPEVDLNSQLEQAICPDIKPLLCPASPPPSPPAPQPEADPALSADSQATTLLAVASMKKLLEESLSTVTHCISEQTDVKREITDEASEEEMKPNLPEMFFGPDEAAPIAADLTLQIKSWQAGADALEEAGSPSPDLKGSSQPDGTAPPLSTSDEVIQPSTCEHSSQTPSTFIVNPCMDAPEGPSSPRRTPRLQTRRAGQQSCCAPDPPKLHHVAEPHKHSQQHSEQHCQAQEQVQGHSSPSAESSPVVVKEQGGFTSLQRKREYWKLMKRQQRARSKARQRERPGEFSNRLIHRNMQASGLVMMNSVKDVSPPKPALHPKASVTSLTAKTSIPSLLVVSPTTCNAKQSPDRMAVTREQIRIHCGPSQIGSDCSGAPENRPQAVPGSQRWTLRSSHVDSASSLPTLKPPDNPLSSINLQPIEPSGQPPDPIISPMKIPQSPKQSVPPPPKLAPVNTMVPPKRIPGESEEDFLKRKREYWRIKKKEQRARKAIQDKAITPRTGSQSWRPLLPAHELHTQDSSQWVNSEHLGDESDHQTSHSPDTDEGPFPFPSYTAPLQDESELLFPDYENNNCEEGTISEATWRNRYLMDYDPLNQLLVCMVCGELQYSHSLEGVRAHIDEAHPDTLTLEPAERQRILEAWDEQVSQRERFFTSQLQQHGGALAESNMN